jgi:murein L,D-transpeptidase YafK
LAVTHRKWTRFLTLATASVVTLCLGAWLSYEAAIHQEPAPARLSENLSETPATPSSATDLARTDLPAADVSAQVATVAPSGATLPEAVSEESRDVAIRASSPEDMRSLFAEADAGAAPLELRGASASEVPATQPASGAQATRDPAPMDELGPLPEAIAPPNLPDRPVPVEGVPQPPRRPAGLAPAQPAPTQVASLGPVAIPTSPALTVAPEVAVLPQATAPKPAGEAKTESKAVAAPKSAASQPATPAPAAAPADGGFPNIGNALAAVSASVGGADATLAPQSEASPVSPEPASGFKKGAQVFVRIFKREGALELWMKKGDHFALYKNYPICKWSGKLGPKQAYADYQSPEGFYSVSAKQLNPHSAYHLAFDVGYPNAYDRRHGYTGNKIMVHGDCKSVGCFAMTNAGIDEIYGFVAAALANGQQEVPVHIFPFRMTEAAIARESAGDGSFLAFLDSGGPKQDWSAFWRNLKEGYDLFERTRVPPTAYACGDRYEFSASAGSCARIAGR